MRLCSFIIALSVFFSSCSTGSHKKPINCENMGVYGDEYICLPGLANYEECYDDVIVRMNWKKFTSEKNETIGLFLRVEDKKRMKENPIGIDKFYHVYGVKGMHTERMSNSELRSMTEKSVEAISSQEFEENLDIIEKDWAEQMLEIGKPMMLKSINPYKGHYGCLFIQKVKSENGSNTILNALNFILIDGIPIIYTYQAQLDHYKSIDSFQIDNDSFGQRLLLVNNQITF